MTVGTEFHNWQTSGLDPVAFPFDRASPNLELIRDHLIDEWGGVSLGIHSDRTIRNGSSPSSHAYGAALDWRWGYADGFPGARWLDREDLERLVLPWLIRWSAELGVQAIHDQGRIWRAYRSGDRHGGWKAYRTNYGPWLHIETTLSAFENTTPILDRAVPRSPGFAVIPLPGHPGSTFDPLEGEFGLWPLRQPPFADWPPNTSQRANPSGDHVRYLQGVILHCAGGRIAVDGRVGPQTERRVRDLQRFFALTVDGWVGRQTWPIVHLLAGMIRDTP